MIDKEPGLKQLVYDRRMVFLSYDGPRAMVPMYDMWEDECDAIEWLLERSDYLVTMYVCGDRAGYLLQEIEGCGH